MGAFPFSQGQIRPWWSPSPVSRSSSWSPSCLRADLPADAAHDIEALAGLLEGGRATGELLPATDRHVDVGGLDLHSVAHTPKLLRRDERGARPEERLVHAPLPALDEARWQRCRERGRMPPRAVRRPLPV